MQSTGCSFDRITQTSDFAERAMRPGLVDEETWQKTLDKEKAIEAEIKRTEHVTIGGNLEVQELLEEKGRTF